MSQKALESYLHIAVCILAKDEGANIGRTLVQLARQTFIRAGASRVDVHVVANGSTDDTVDKALEAAPEFEGTSAKLHVHDLHPGGKSRAWNTAVHDLTDAGVSTFVFIDADITFADDAVISDLLETLKNDKRAEVCSGYPVKDVSAKRNKSPLDLFSLAISSRTRHVGVINGSLYVGRAECLRRIWLPNQTPGEDGFLNAMVTTDGFTVEVDPRKVRMSERPTHYFKAHRPLEFVDHERRLIVATIVNRWIFEHLWSLNRKDSVGPLIAEYNAKEPDWVETLIQERGANRRWLVPNAILFGRLRSNGSQAMWRKMAHLPLGIAATLLTLPPALRANRRLKRRGASSSW